MASTGSTPRAPPDSRGTAEYLRKQRKLRPSAALLKAALVAGATRVPGGPQGAVVDNDQGYGRVNVDAQGDSYVLSGFVGSDDELRQVKQAAAAIPNTVVGDIQLAPWPQCEAMLTL